MQRDYLWFDAQEREKSHRHAPGETPPEAPDLDPREEARSRAMAELDKSGAFEGLRGTVHLQSRVRSRVLEKHLRGEAHDTWEEVSNLACSGDRWLSEEAARLLKERFPQGRGGATQDERAPISVGPVHWPPQGGPG